MFPLACHFPCPSHPQYEHKWVQNMKHIIIVWHRRKDFSTYKTADFPEYPLFWSHASQFYRLRQEAAQRSNSTPGRWKKNSLRQISRLISRPTKTPIHWAPFVCRKWPGCEVGRSDLPISKDKRECSCTAGTGACKGTITLYFSLPRSIRMIP